MMTAVQRSSRNYDAGFDGNTARVLAPVESPIEAPAETPPNGTATAPIGQGVRTAPRLGARPAPGSTPLHRMGVNCDPRSGSISCLLQRAVQNAPDQRAVFTATPAFRAMDARNRSNALEVFNAASPAGRAG